MPISDNLPVLSTDATLDDLGEAIRTHLPVSAWFSGPGIFSFWFRGRRIAIEAGHLGFRMLHRSRQMMTFPNAMLTFECLCHVKEVKHTLLTKNQPVIAAGRMGQVIDWLEAENVYLISTKPGEFERYEPDEVIPIQADYFNDNQNQTEG